MLTGLNRDKWHHVILRINPGTAHLSVRVDDNEMTVSLPSLAHYPSYGITNEIPETVMYFGGEPLILLNILKIYTKNLICIY